MCRTSAHVSCVRCVLCVRCVPNEESEEEVRDWQKVPSQPLSHWHSPVAAQVPWSLQKVPLMMHP
jgi:hypothetical protein